MELLNFVNYSRRAGVRWPGCDSHLLERSSMLDDMRKYKLITNVLLPISQTVRSVLEFLSHCTSRDVDQMNGSNFGPSGARLRVSLPIDFPKTKADVVVAPQNMLMRRMMDAPKVP